MNKTHLGPIQLVIFAICTILLTGCASTVVQSTQIVTQSMVIVPPRPSAPTGNDITQRDVANYIVLLRGWGNGLAIQLKAIEELIKDKK